MAHIEPEPGTILLAYRGSVAHGMYVPANDPNSIDDVDLIGVVVGTPENYLGLRGWGSRGTKEYWVDHYDCVYYEIRKAVSLLLQGNPNILSMLWLRREHYIFLTAESAELIESRNMFLGKHVYNAFAGYANAQLQKMELRDPEELRYYLAITAEMKHRGIHPNHKGEEFPAPGRQYGEQRDVASWSVEKLRQGLARYQKKGENIGYMGEKRKRLVLEHGYDAKNAAHCVRLLRMALELFRDGVMHVYRADDAPELLDIKAGKWKIEDIRAHAEDLFVQVKSARDSSPLPDGPNFEGIERMLVSILRGRLLHTAAETLPADTEENQE